MAASFSVTLTSLPTPCILQRRRFSPHLRGSALQNSIIGTYWMQGLRPFALNWKRRRNRGALICAVNQDAKEAFENTIEIDSLIDMLRDTDPHEASISHGKQEAVSEAISKHSDANEAWSQFAKRVSGEWDGFGADFSNEGRAIELPETVVPEAYREWEVKVFDWQTQCPTLAQPEDHALEYKSIQLLPTVGCEADAATRYSTDERKVAVTNGGVTAFAYQSSGSYVAIWQKRDKLLELEYCLISPQDFESRVRIIQLIHVLDDTKMVLQSIRVFREQWYGPFRNGEQLGGCAIRDSAFASTAPMAASEIDGIWQGSNAVATFGTPNTEIFRELLDDKVQNSVRDGDNYILLPKKLWCSLKQFEDGETLSEVGWLLDHGQAITSCCLFSSTAKLKEITIALETKALEDV